MTTATSLPPGPSKPVMPFGLAAYMVLGERVLDSAFTRYGKRFSVQVPGMGDWVLLADPALIPDVLTAEPEVLDATEPNKIMSVIYGTEAVVVVDGEQHRRLRKIMLPPMRGRHLERYAEIMAAAADRTLDRLPSGRPFALLPYAHDGIREVILQIVLGIEEPERLGHWMPPFRRMLEVAASEEMTVRYFARKIGGMKTWGALRRTVAECDRLIYAEIASRRTVGLDEDATDMLSLLMAATTEDGGPLPDVEIRDNLMNLVIAGHETSATGFAWALHWAVRDPEVLLRLTSEAKEGTSRVYATAVAREAVRLCPPFAGFARRVRRPFQLGEHLLPVGTTIAVLPRHPHRDPALYDDASAFRPERFLDTAPRTQSYLSFGAGVHRCLGDHFAIMEMAVFLQTMLRRATFEPVSVVPEALKRKSLVNVPAKGCELRLTSRQHAIPLEVSTP